MNIQHLIRSRLWFLGILLIALSINPTNLHAQSVFPENPAGQRAREVIDLLNDGDAKDVEAYFNEHVAEQFRNAFDMQAHIDIFTQIHSDFGPLVADRVMEQTSNRLEMLFQSSGTDQWLNLTLEVEPAPPHRIDRLGFSPGEPPSESEQSPTPSHGVKEEQDRSDEIPLPQGPLTTEKLTDYLDRLLDSLVDSDVFSGAVLIAKHGKSIYKRAVGLASRRYEVLNRTDTKFNLGSMNKMFTGVAVMQLVQQGKLKLEETVGKYLPEYPNEEIRKKVTIHHLLTHTSGMGSYWRGLFSDPRWVYLKTVQEFDNLANTDPLSFEPGERFQYSNSGPLVLGLIIEKVSGQDYHQYIRKNVTGPAGMTNTDCYDVDLPIPNLAIGYTRSGFSGQQYETWHNNLFTHPTKGSAAGGGYSTVEDLLQFDIALRTHTLLKKEHFDMMTTAKTNRNSQRGYAYLFEEQIEDGERIIGHSGGAPGINSTLRMFMHSGYTVAIMTNIDNGLRPVYKKIEELILGEN